MDLLPVRMMYFSITGNDRGSQLLRGGFYARGELNAFVLFHGEVLFRAEGSFEALRPSLFCRRHGVDQRAA